jgi:opacity protein-like surface antigen
MMKLSTKIILMCVALMFSAGGVSGFASSRATTKSNTSMRVGFGLGYKLNEGTQLVTAVQYSNYGEVFWKNSDNNNGITAKIKSVEAGIRLVFDL